MPSREDVSAFLPALFRERTPIPFAFNLIQQAEKQKVFVLERHAPLYSFWEISRLFASHSC